MIQEFIKDLGKYLPAQVVPAIVGFFSIPIITRLFLPADYGNYALALATVSILSAIAGWLSMSIIRFHPVYEREGELEEFYSDEFARNGLDDLQLRRKTGSGWPGKVIH